jgi:molybdopterin/thiamine biosynthesis adenylyltransferase
VLHAERTPSGLIRLGTSQYGVATDVHDRQDGLAWRLLGLMDGTRDIPSIVDSIVHWRPSLTESVVRGAVDQLIDAGFVEDAGAPSPQRLSSEEMERYRYNAEYFAWVDTNPRQSRWDSQERLKRSRVTVVGVGGTGSAVALSLVAAGVGRIRAVDCDVVEVSNLSRQLLYTEDDVGRDKVDVAAGRLSGLNSHVQVEVLHRRVSSIDDAMALLAGEDLLILSADTPRGQIQRWVNDAAQRCGTPWLLCGYAGPMVVMGLFMPFDTPCYRCIEHAERTRVAPGESLGATDGEAIRAVVAPTANLSGHFAALEAIYFLAGIGARTAGRMFHQNLMMFEHSYYVEAVRWPECPVCGTDPSRGDEHRTHTPS